jgi:hypothetical protein
MNKKMDICTPKTNQDGLCPNCGAQIKEIEYYSARPIKSNVTTLPNNTQRVEITYTDLAQHFGGLCLNCAYLNDEPKRKNGSMMMIFGLVGSSIGLFAGIILIIIANGANSNVGNTAQIIAFILSFLLFIAGIAGWSMKREGKKYKTIEADMAFLGPEASMNFFTNTFLVALNKIEKNQGLSYFRPDQVSKLKVQ